VPQLRVKRYRRVADERGDRARGGRHAATL
jgi:hypothetical protein